MLTFVIFLLLLTIAGLSWVYYQQDRAWRQELHHLGSGEDEDPAELLQFVENEEKFANIKKSSTLARLRLLASQYGQSLVKEENNQAHAYVDDSHIYSEESWQEEVEQQDSDEFMEEEIESESIVQSMVKSRRSERNNRPPRIPEITPFWQNEPTEAECISHKLGMSADLEEITLEEATQSLHEAILTEMAEQTTSVEQQATKVTPLTMRTEYLETIELSDPAVRRTRERVIASVRDIIENMPLVPKKGTQTEAEISVPRQEIGVNDIQENLVRTRAARNKIAAVEAPLRHFQPKVIPDEEVYANLLHISTPAFQRSNRRVETQPKEQFVPEVARMEKAPVNVPPKQVVPPKKQVIVSPKPEPKTTPVFIDKPAPPTATVVEPPIVPKVDPQPINIAEPPVFSQAPVTHLPEPMPVNAHISHRPHGKIADLLISEASKVVLADSILETHAVQTTSAEKDVETEAIFERQPQKAMSVEPVVSVAPTVPTVEAEILAEEKHSLVDMLSEKHLPTVDLLLPPQFDPSATPTEEILMENSITIEEKLAEFKVKVKVVDSYSGPVITRYEIEPDVGVRGNAVLNLEKDLARSLGVSSIRVMETIPGKTCMGLELPNPKRQIIRLSEIFNSSEFQQSKSKLTLALGQDITGKPVVTDLAKAPHLLVAGTTGSGKSVGVNAMILSMLFKATPEEVRMIMIDPKMLELSIYEGIPHLLTPVVTDMKLAANALNWCVNEMEKRYRLMSHVGVRNLEGFNQKIAQATAKGAPIVNPFSLTPEPPEYLEKLPFIVVVVDEFADLMMTAGKKIEELIARLAQKARAAGIHLILATQRPSVDVITGLIKANIPTRIAFQVSSKIDSRTILDQMGAENLLGQGDMLFQPPGTSDATRVHGAFASDEEVHRVVEYLKQFGEPDYIDAILNMGSEESGFGRSNDGEIDPLYDEAINLVVKTRKASISSVQRTLRIGYNRAARLIEQMEADGIISAAESNGNRTVLAPSSHHLD